MATAVAELETALQAMLGQKPPKVSGTRIASLTALCNDNVQSESVLIQKIYTHFKKAPGTHKLGVLYVVDSVTRKWTEQAKNAGQTINSSAPDGTYAAGVHRVKELLPVLMNDIILTAPIDQKEKIRKLIEIWEKSQTFPLSMLNTFKEKLNAQDAAPVTSNTPPGSPPPDLQGRLGFTNPPTSVASDTSAILAALANMARQNTSAPPASSIAPQYQAPVSAPAPASTPALAQFPTSAQSQDNSYNVPNIQNAPSHQASALNPTIPPLFPSAIPAPVAPTTFLPQPSSTNNTAPNFSNQTNNYTGVPPVLPYNSGLDPAVQQQLLLIKALSDQGFTPDKIAGIIAAVGNRTTVPLPQPVNTQTHIAPIGQSGQNAWNMKMEDSRDRDGFEPSRSPSHRYRRRTRSRSPQGLNVRDSPMRRREEGGFEFERDSPLNRRDDRSRGRGRSTDYRQRSPSRRAQSPSPPHISNPTNKWIGYDTTIPKGSIKVLSRTLFVGGVTGTEQELRQLFSRYGQVQTCVVNRDKRHAFVKMVSRADAVAAKDAMEKTRIPESSLRTRWGVGFGPRDCSDYATGVSIIPISKLTDADRKWMLSAEYGGSGGAPIESGMVVEEPDIEIGQGVSSKAISRRMQTDRGGNNGPKSSRDRDDADHRRTGREPGKDEFGRDLREDDRKDHAASISGPPSMPAVPPFGMLPPGFPFSLSTQPNGMPMFPPGFNFLGQQTAPAQPPPPGRN
ncbi:Rpb7-binding protein seb1 [Golovinomyces cichoracearum]|uniref:Rpb7-binding protein seb1 n=1 Tax=Golovinomyces cichoracearum TaxID=62708 RepID=A0A420HGB1_9PEZI|nr:Rpb7-binding protein seb1 [Golovinomyces cichoracearum]